MPTVQHRKSFLFLFFCFFFFLKIGFPLALIPISKIIWFLVCFVTTKNDLARHAESGIRRVIKSRLAKQHTAMTRTNSFVSHHVLANCKCNKSAHIFQKKSKTTNFCYSSIQQHNIIINKLYKSSYQKLASQPTIKKHSSSIIK